MEQNRFFKFLWRANAVFLFAAGLLLVGMLLMSAFFLINDFGYSKTPPPSVSTSTEQNRAEEIFSLRAPSRKYGDTPTENFTYFELRSGVDSYAKLSSGSASQLRNIAVFDLNKNTTHWVFPDSGQQIENYDDVRRAVILETGDKKWISTGFLLTVAKTLPDRTVSRDLWVMTPDGKTLKKILSDISDSPDIERYGDDKIKLVLETKTHIDVYPFDVDMLTVGEPTRVSIP